MCSNKIAFISKVLVNQSINVNSTRCYARWTHRTPSKVMLPFESSTNLREEKVIDLVADLKEKPQNKSIDTKVKKVNAKNIITPEKLKAIKEKREDQQKKKTLIINQNKVFDESGNIIYQKLKENDGRVIPLIVKLKSKKERLRTKQMLVEGWRMIVDGLEAKCKLKYVIFSQVDDLNKLRPFLPKSGVIFYKVPYKEIELWSDVETSPGLFGVFEMPTVENTYKLSKSIPLQFICDNIRTPGNLGAILRAAVGVGCDNVILTKGCVDLWDPKVIRSASGAHFRQTIHNSIEWDEINKLLPKDTSIFVADSNTDNFDTPMGNEDLLQSNLPVVPYYGVDFSNLKHVTLIIGGETEGISGNSYELAAGKNGVRLNIPLQRGVDSLNTGMAAAIIAFEIKKQFVQTRFRPKLQKQEIEAT